MSTSCAGRATRPGDPMTARQAEVLAFVRSFAASHGHPPTTDEISAAFGFASRNAAHCHLRALRKKGLIRWEPRRCRSLVVVEVTADDTARLRDSHAELLSAAEAILTRPDDCLVPNDLWAGLMKAVEAAIELEPNP